MSILCSQRSTSWYPIGWAGYKEEAGVGSSAPQWSRMMGTLLSPICYWPPYLSLSAYLHRLKELHKQKFAVLKNNNSLTLNWPIHSVGNECCKDLTFQGHVGYRLYRTKSQDFRGSGSCWDLIGQMCRKGNKSFLRVLRTLLITVLASLCMVSWDSSQGIVPPYGSETKT